MNGRGFKIVGLSIRRGVIALLAFGLLLSLQVQAQMSEAMWLAQQKAESDQKIALTYAVPIVIAGALVGVGVFLGLQKSKGKQ